MADPAPGGGLPFFLSCTSSALYFGGFYQVQYNTTRLSSGLELVWFGLVSFIECFSEGLCCQILWNDRVTSFLTNSPAIFICRLMEVLRKLVGTVSLLSPPYLLLRFQPFLPALGKAVLCPLLVVTALTSPIQLLLNHRLLLTLSAPKQDDLLPLPP